MFVCFVLPSKVNEVANGVSRLASAVRGASGVSRIISGVILNSINSIKFTKK